MISKYLKPCTLCYAGLALVMLALPASATVAETLCGRPPERSEGGNAIELTHPRHARRKIKFFKVQMYGHVNNTEELAFGCGKEGLAHPRLGVDKESTIRAGKWRAPSRNKGVLLELGGKNALIADAAMLFLV